MSLIDIMLSRAEPSPFDLGDTGGIQSRFREMLAKREAGSSLWISYLFDRCATVVFDFGYHCSFESSGFGCLCRLWLSGLDQIDNGREVTTTASFWFLLLLLATYASMDRQHFLRIQWQAVDRVCQTYNWARTLTARMLYLSNLPPRSG